MDTHTLELLEFEKVRTLVAARAACSLGKDEARRMEPSRDLGEIRARQALTTEMADALVAGLTPPFGGLHDVRPLVRRAQVGSMLAPEELAEIVESLRAVRNLDQWLARVGDEFPRLGALKREVGEFSSVINAIEGCLDNRGKVLDTASRKLSEIRREVGQAEERIQETLRRMLRSSELKRILRYPNFTMVGHHYVLPIAKEHRGEIQGSVHRTSASNETVFVEPQAIAEQSAQLSFLRAREAKEVRRILRWLTAQVGQVADSLLGSLTTLAELDLVFARGRLSLDYKMSPPDFNTEGRLVLRGARHPLLEALFRGEFKTPAPETDGDEPPPPPEPTEPRSVVPIDVHLGLRFNILVVTGPNTGGKTVALKTVGLLAVMAQAGLHVPAHQGSQLPVFDAVLADIGDEQSLEQSLSTFSSHIRRVSEILSKATEHSLVMLDELGAGTDPAEGAALGRAILDELDSIGCRAIVTTHLGDLKTYAFTNPRTENAAVEFDLETLRPLYRLHTGDIGQSNALQIARRLNLAEHLVARAGRYLQEAQGDRVPELEIVQKLRQEAEAARQSALTAQAEAERSREALAQRLTDLQREAENDARLVEARARLQPGDRVVVPRFGYDRPGRVVKLDPRKKTAVVAIGMMQWDVAIDELIPQVVRTPDVPAAPAGGKGKTGAARGAGRLEDFRDETG
ncbi:MAG: DNA strand exchange inhibitor protein [Isosphaeraceae bacterium]|nr:DNA strand exchange inhibitor protein [Isosphaeraceae bacterium]